VPCQRFVDYSAGRQVLRTSGFWRGIAARG
jgi:hypothetical protein